MLSEEDLCYYAKAEDYTLGKAPKGSILLMEIEAIAIAGGGRIHLSVVNRDVYRTYYLKADDSEESHQWLEAIRRCQEVLANKLDVKVAEADLPAVLTLALPGGGIATTECRGDSTGADFKRQLVEQYPYVGRLLPTLAADSVHCLLEGPGNHAAATYWADDEPLMATSFWPEARRTALTRMEVIAAEEVAEKRREFDIVEGVHEQVLKLVGKPLLDSEEADDARRHFQKHFAPAEPGRLWAKKNPMGWQKLREYGRGQIRATCYLPGGATEEMDVPINERVGDFKGRVVGKYGALTGAEPDAAGFQIKLLDRREYLQDDGLVGDYNFVHAAAMAGKGVALRLEEAAAPSAGDFAFEEGVVRRAQAEALAGGEPEAAEYSGSLWDIHSPFDIKVLEFIGHPLEGAANSKLERLLSKGTNVRSYVTASVCYNGDVLANLISHTTGALWSHSPRWAETLAFSILISDLPREARLCFTVYATADEFSSVPVGWVSLMLMDFRGQLRTGLIGLRVWPYAEANPITTCMENLSGNHTGTLFVELPTFAMPIRFPENAVYDADEIAATREQRFRGSIRASVAPLSVREPTVLPDNIRAQLEKVTKADPLVVPSPFQKELIWKFRKGLTTDSNALPKFLMSVPWEVRENVWETHLLLESWCPPTPTAALELLGSKFADTRVRKYAIRCLQEIDGDALEEYILQLVQVLKCEPYDKSDIADFLLKQALANVRIGHQFFWHLKAEMHVESISRRYGVLLEQYLLMCGPYVRADLIKQWESNEAFLEVAVSIKSVKGAEEKLAAVRKGLADIALPDSYQLPLDPAITARNPKVEKCKFMDSKKLPLWLVLENEDPRANPIFIIFKAGDDLRQDLLTLQMIRIMDKIWKDEGLDLGLNAYGAVATGDETGMLEVVLNSDTTSNISKAAGGGAACFRDDPMANWLREHNPDEASYSQAVQNFICSCAGYCVATCVLGIGDRHNDNVMLQKTGHLFHIDFGHFLGNFKEKYGIKRERARFVLTPDFAYVMGGEKKEKGEGFKEFEELCVQAYSILREQAPLFINLFSLMLYAGIPELRRPEDIQYLKDQFNLSLSDQEAGETFRSWIYESLYCKTTQINNAIHILAH